MMKVRFTRIAYTLAAVAALVVASGAGQKWGN
jgi:hypothetical protein